MQDYPDTNSAWVDKQAQFKIWKIIYENKPENEDEPNAEQQNKDSEAGCGILKRLTYLYRIGVYLAAKRATKDKPEASGPHSPCGAPKRTNGQWEGPSVKNNRCVPEQST